MRNPVLSVQDLRTHFFTGNDVARAVDGISLDFYEGETLGIVGESGCGKSVTCLSILRLVPPPGRIVGGKVLFAGQDLLELPEREMRRIRGKQISMVFQDPMTSLNPFLTIGEQVAELLQVHDGLSRRQARQRAIAVLESVGIPDAATRLGEYPHRFSGGMRQRVMIAMALVGHPRVLIADEPTTALDVTIQAQVLELFRHIRSERGTSILLVTHNLGIVAGIAERVAVMYAGRVVECSPTQELFDHPRHPYTLALLEAMPQVGDEQHDLRPIAGAPPDLRQLPPGCSFYARCPFRQQKCAEQSPPLVPVAPDHLASCWVDVTARREGNSSVGSP